MAKTIELRRHTDNDDDVLSPEGVEAAVEVGRHLPGTDYHAAYSSGAQRATQAVGCMIAGHGKPVPQGIAVEPGLRSKHEDRWRELAKQAGGSDLAAIRELDEEFVDAEAATLSDALRRILDALPDGGRALAVGHSPTNEAAVFGLTGTVVEPMQKGEGAIVVADGGTFTVTPTGG